MGRSMLSFLKITLLPLAICLLLSINSQVFGKPSPKHYLIETKEKAKTNNDYINNINNAGGIKTIVDGSTNVGKDYENDYIGPFGDIDNIGPCGGCRCHWARGEGCHI